MFLVQAQRLPLEFIADYLAFQRSDCRIKNAVVMIYARNYHSLYMNNISPPEKINAIEDSYSNLNKAQFAILFQVSDECRIEIVEKIYILSSAGYL